VPQTVSALQEMRGARGGPERVFHYLPFCFAGSRMVLWTQLARPNPLMISTDLDDLKQEMATAEANYFLNVPALLERIRKGVNDMIRDKGGLARLMYERGEAAYLRSVEGQGRWLDGLWLAVGRKVFSKIRQRIGARLEFLICGSAPLSDETQRWFEMLGIPVLQVYGLTETTAIVTMDKPGRVVSGRVGLAIDGCELKLSEEGELLCRGPNIFQGYWGREEASADCLVDGWFATGDLAEIDPEGRVRIIGRAKNQLVLESGHNVAPEPIEQMLREACPAIEQAVVLGHGRPDLAVIVTGSVGGVALEAALERVNESLPHYRRLRRHHLASQAFTPESGLLTANQKLRRSVIEAHFEPVLQELYS
jgi:long-chain acyl-CoA synthetase